MWLWLAAVALGGCDTETVREAVRGAEAAYQALDFDRFGTEAVVLEDAAGCLEELASPRLAARVHWVRSLSAWIARDQQALARRLRAMVAADRFYEPDPAMVPEGSQLRFALDQARSWEPKGTSPLPDGAWTLDGYGGASALPVGRAALVQLHDETVQTWLLDDTSQSLPEALVRPTPPPGVDPAVASGTEAAVSGPRVSRPLVLAGSAAVVAGAAGLVVAAMTRGAYLQESDADAAEGLKTANTAAGAAGISLLAVGAGLGATAIIAGRW